MSRSVEPSEAAFIFLSADLSNATVFKTRDRTWPLVVKKFYELLTKDLQSEVSDARVWKHLGDEVIFYKQIKTADDAAQAVMSLSTLLQSVIEQIHLSFPQTEGILDLKGCAWTAVVWKYPSNSIQDIQERILRADPLDSNNLIANDYQNVPSGPVEFLGREIDHGFRLSQHTHRRVVTLSPDLARLICLDASKKPHGPTSTMRIVDYAIMKGAWLERPCPVIWYYRDWENIEATFHYDEMSSDRYDKVCNRSAELSVEERLKKIYSDLGIEKRFERLIRALNQPPLDHGLHSDDNVEVERLAEVHIVCVCRVKGGNRVLAAKRNDDRRVEPGKWEFGCNQLRRKTSIPESIAAGYKSDFGVNVSRLSVEPFQTYFIDSKGVPGFVYTGEISAADADKAQAVTGKHSEVRTFTLAEAEALGADAFVPKGLDRVRYSLATG